MLFDRTEASLTAATILADRLRNRLRVESGSTYAVDLVYEALSARQVHAVLTADCEEHRVLETRNNFLVTLDSFAATGPTQEELEEFLTEEERREHDPDFIRPYLAWYARDEVLGEPYKTHEEYARLLRALTTEQVRAEVATTMKSLLVIVPEGAPLPGGRFEPYPLDSPGPVVGKTHRPRSPRGWLGTNKMRLIVSEEAITQQAEHIQTVRFSDCVGMLCWQDGERGLFGSDAMYIFVDPKAWIGGEGIVALIDQRVPDELRVHWASGEVEDPELEAGVEAARAGDPERAMALYEKAAAANPANLRAWILIGSAAVNLKWFSRALEAGDKAVELDPADPRGHRVRAEAMRGLGREREALEALDASTELDPTGIDTLCGVAWELLALSHVDRAATLADRAVELHPDSASAWSVKGGVEQRRGNLGEAESSSRRALNLNRKEPSWHNNLGWVVLRQGRPREAIQHFKAALELEPRHAPARWNLPTAHALAGRQEEADKLRREVHLQDLERQQSLLSKSPGDASLHLETAIILARLRRDDESHDEARIARELTPHNGLVLDELAASALRVGHRDEAWSVLEQLVAVEEPEQGHLRSQAWIAAILEDPELSKAAAERVQPPPEWMKDLAEGQAAAAEEDWSAAAERLEAVFADRPYHCCAAAWRGLVAATAGDMGSARHWLELSRKYGDCIDPARRMLEEAVEAASAALRTKSV